MADVMLVRGIPEHIRSDNGPDMTAKIVRQWFASVGAETLLHRTRQSLGEQILRKF